MNKLPLFILSYGGSKCLDQILNPDTLPDVDVRILDNGNQEWSSKLKPLVMYQTSTNIGCAGGWNLISKIGFDYFNFDKIIISNDDNVFNEIMLGQINNRSNTNTIYGTYDRSFEFSLFSICKDTYSNVGSFDENFIYVTGEDDDYKYRCKLKGVSVESLNVGADCNLSLTSQALPNEVRGSNGEYIIEKWGNPRIYTSPFNNTKPFAPRAELIQLYKPIYGDRIVNQFPSEIEFENFLLKQKKGL